MNLDRTELQAIETADEQIGQFFAPASTDMIDGLVAQYRHARQRIAEVAGFLNGELCSGVIHYFLDGNSNPDRGRISLESATTQLFQESGAVSALNAAYWSKTLSLTDIYDAMPQAKRDEWNKQIRYPNGVKNTGRQRDKGEWESPPLPDFEEETVRGTIVGLLNERTNFLAQRVDGIFRALSGEHVTNSPAAFGKRMIIGYLISSYGTSNHDRVGYINDLRCVIAKFMGRDEPKWNSSSAVVERARSTMRGQWVSLDGGALRLRAYKCGTAHLEVHPDMAWRLNQILAHLYPMAIPPEFRTKPKKKPKDFVMMGRPLPFAVIELLAGMKRASRLVKQEGNWRQPYRSEDIRNALEIHAYTWEQASQQIRDEAERVLFMLGAVRTSEGHYQFDYDVGAVLGEITTSGCIPDQKSYQFYPTSEKLARIAIERAEICEFDTVLEPSAGQGGIADHLPKDRTTCVEISPLHCAVLKAKGFDTVEADFVAWSETAPQFSAVVMNPPFSDGRAVLHVERASALVKPGGRLVAILPASMRGKDILPGFDCTWSEVFSNEFPGTSVSVVILKASRRAG